MSPKKKAYRNLADTMIKNFKRRNIEAFYCENRDEAKHLAMNMMKDGGTVGFGGSVTLEETGILEAVEQSSLTLIDRRKAQTPEETREVFLQTIGADYFLMSSNAVTIDGELINIDGKGNRVACLVYGPRQVILLVGMNKVVTDRESGIRKIQNVSAPVNASAFDLKTPCGVTGCCGDCHSPQSMCCSIVITRHSRFDGRIKVILIGEELGH